MDLDLQGKSALITGGSKGIGLACAHAFAAEGCHLHLASRDADRLEKVSRTLRERHAVRVAIYSADLRDPVALHALATACADVEILVNNAGDIPGGTIETIDDQTWRHAWELKLFAYINLTREMYVHMKSRGRGTILNIIGMAGEQPSFEYICGSAAGGALIAFTKGMGKGSREHGVRILGLNPASTRTERVMAVMKAASKAKFGDENRYEDLIRAGVFTKLIEPEQVADAAVFLASPRAGALSGVTLSLGA